MTALDYQALIHHMTVRLARVNRALSSWDELMCQTLLPPDLRRQVRRPELSLEALKGLQIMLLEEMTQVAVQFQASMPFSLN